MIKKAILSLVFLLLWCVRTDAQALEEVVTMHYEGQPLKTVLADITLHYGVQFTYSSKIVPVNQMVSFVVREEPLSAALGQLFDQNALAHAKIGNQIVIKPRKKAAVVEPPKKKVEKIGMLETNLPRNLKQQSPLYHDAREVERLAMYHRVKYRHIASIQSKNFDSVEGGGDQVIKWDSERLSSLTEEIQSEEPFTRLAQVSILPYVGTNALKSNEVTNNFSLNLFWGTNGGVEGVEVGGFVNTIKNDVKGVQVAGLGNSVGNDVVGTQVSGLFNSAGGELEGAQVSGLFNYAKEAKAVQVSSLFNFSPTAFTGVQVSSLFNVSGKGEGVQVSGLFNANKGSARTQISGLMNVAGDISGGQVSSLMNVARKVKGFQIGLINVADTVSGVPIGLLNIVKRGYNRVELASNEALFANFSLKLGARSFYNIFHIGIRWDKTAYDNGLGQQQVDILNSWGLGYGIGTAIPFNQWLLMNIEALAIHINETEEWTDELNMLTQLKILFDIRVGRRTSFFVGPSGNLMISRLYDPDTNTIGSNIMPYTLYEETNGDTNTKMWVGFNAGVRF